MVTRGQVSSAASSCKQNARCSANGSDPQESAATAALSKLDAPRIRVCAADVANAKRGGADRQTNGEAEIPV